ncbi:AAA family ATPase [Natrinema thermotolerans]|uniref:Cytidylate kinase n=1 Tax=Natrinema thermotolerans TaxID=121872 RepID=A0AAF0SZG2_9EURY|nr:AAA family ATPase [Natrinema thermotolerans]ELZ07741.1 cytidylate kinase [Natrinema thermotolerans DSM 11552]QCC60621.1 AAA family ATPase [Natrinema thermotolerans]QCC61507.1 AAA family ATPase [Natrinema thermotolerans]WMT07664.1 AAA family ATPase [Natrinema thermotolerans]WMT08296.1 AAA family ATPase [Natrinema thermotolerans]
MAAQEGSTVDIDTSLFITVSGPPGCGATTLCEQLADAIGCPYVSGGEVFRELAEDRDMSLNQLIAKADESDEIDRALDQRLQQIAEKWGMSNKPFILESRLAGWIAGDRADLRLWLDAPEAVRLDRIDDRIETEAEMRVREVSEAGRYESYYEIDIDDREFYDLHINTARWSKRAVFTIVRSAIEEYDPEIDEGAFRTPPMNP